MASAAAGSHLMLCGIEGCTRRSQVSVGRVGSSPSRIAPADAGTRISSAAAIAGAARRARDIGISDGVAEQCRQRGRQHGQEAQPVNPDPGGALQHRERPRKAARPDIPDQVPRKPGQDMAAQPFGRAPRHREQADPRRRRQPQPAARRRRYAEHRGGKQRQKRRQRRTRRTAEPTRNGRYRQTAPPRSSTGRRRKNREPKT